MGKLRTAQNGKGDGPRKETPEDVKKYRENFDKIFPNAFRPSWDRDSEDRKDTPDNARSDVQNNRN